MQIESSELFDAFAEDLLAERSSRPLLIVGASKVDQLLFEVLNVFLLPKIAKGKEHDELLKGDTPLATFSARIKMCRRLGLIDETLYLALEKLRSLRNLCAHSISFDHEKSPVREHLADLRKQLVGRASYQLTKQRFFDDESLSGIEESQCLLLTLCVLLQMIREQIKPISGNKRALYIASK